MITATIFIVLDYTIPEGDSENGDSSLACMAKLCAISVFYAGCSMHLVQDSIRELIYAPQQPVILANGDHPYFSQKFFNNVIVRSVQQHPRSQAIYVLADYRQNCSLIIYESTEDSYIAPSVSFVDYERSCKTQTALLAHMRRTRIQSSYLSSVTAITGSTVAGPRGHEGSWTQHSRT